MVTVSGKITFDRIPFDSTAGNGLNPDAIAESPARGIVVEAVRSSGSTIASTVTDSDGNYSLSVPSDTTIFIRAKAQMLKTDAGAKWKFQVLNNRRANTPVYALEGANFTTGNTAITRNLRAPAGLNDARTTYTGERASAPFAILDTIYRAVELIRTASHAAQFGELDVFWSPENRPTFAQDFCVANGYIGTTFYTPGGPDETECSGYLAAGIYVLGDFTDTDEFDQHVIAHEFGHYVEDTFGRSDSIGGSHSEGARLDMRTAFGEGWGNAFAAMVLGDPVYRDSYNGFARDGLAFDLEEDSGSASDGWFSEASIGEVLWDAFDATNEPGDTLSLSFGFIFAALERQRTTPALTSIFSFASALRAVAPDAAAGLRALLSNEQIYGDDEFGSSEVNGGNLGAGTWTSVLPIYRTLTLGQAQQMVCVTAQNGAYNGLGYNKFFRLDLATARMVTISVQGFADGPGTDPAENPEMYLYREGAVEAYGLSNASRQESISQQPLEAGTYILELYDGSLTGGSRPRCMSVTAVGN
jgi:hypothetical protein